MTVTDPAPITHVLEVLDMSGSMDPLAEDVRGGFNTYIQGLRGEPGNYWVTAVVFDTRFESLCTAATLDAVPQLTTKNYSPRGGTALCDAIGKTITDFEAGTTLAEGDKVLLVVHTDGYENSSREYTPAIIKKMITDREATGRWSALFIGAGLDVAEQAAGLGFAGANTITVAATGAATRSTYDSMTRATSSYAAGASAQTTAGLIAEGAGGTTDPKRTGSKRKPAGAKSTTGTGGGDA